MKTKLTGMGIVTLGLISWLCCAGCGGDNAAERFFKTGRGRFLSPDKPLLQPDEAQVNWIIQSTGEMDKTEELYPDATRPGPEDWIYSDSDYVIGPTDVLGISVQDLYYEGVETMLQREVSNSGYIDLPLLADRIKAEGMTAMELTRAIEQAYSPAVIKDKPIVTVTLMLRRKQMFSVLGAVMRPGTYQITRPDMRMLEAMALCGGESQPNIEYIYVIRSAPPLRQSEQDALKKAPAETAPATPAPATPAPAAPPADKPEELRDIGDLMKSAVSSPTRLESLEADSTEVCHYSETSPGPVPERIWTPMSESASASTPAVAPTPQTPSPAQTPKKSLRWVYRDGQWVQEEVRAEPVAPSPVPSPAPSPAPAPRRVTPPAPRAIPTPRPEPIAPPVPEDRALPEFPSDRPESPADEEDPFGWAKAEKKDQVRIIAVNLKKLQQGDYRQNIVIRENDIIQIPSLEIGEFFVMGEVMRPGAYSLTGRKVTIKMALASAGNLNALAWPGNSMLIRRIGKNQEQTIPINIESILRGTEPDMYLKPNDIIAVGTHWSTSFLAVMRNAFRMTYGFGFIYDRNFSDPVFYYPNSKRFKGL
ncbi:MAG: polysaccharide biosynthesis/export family protein [Phycisphaerae bacterium]|nr:polysaccharide biosynthesis/export family protein [Phycisphaerae bacterium]